jgi:RNA polymerase sigma-70 factor (ECF subfamily)
LFDFGSERQSAKNPSVKIVAMRQAKQSVEARQRDIYDSHRHRTFALAYYMTGNEMEAEQILTSTFVRAFRAAEEPNGPDVDSALLEELRQKSYLDSDAAASACSTPAGSSDPDPSVELAGRNVKRTDLEEAIQVLAPTERLLFLLRDVEGYTPAVIAQLLQITEPQVQRGLFAARLRLRRALAEAQLAESKAA